MESLNFGDIFSFNGREYVFLVATKNITYTAKILDKEFSKRMVLARNSAIRKNSFQINNLVYSFVELETEELKGRVAHLQGSDSNVSHVDVPLWDLLSMVLTKKDLREIRDEIVKKRTVSERLKKEVQKLKI